MEKHQLHSAYNLLANGKCPKCHTQMIIETAKQKIYKFRLMIEDKTTKKKEIKCSGCKLMLTL